MSNAATGNQPLVEVTKRAVPAFAITTDGETAITSGPWTNISPNTAAGYVSAVTYTPSATITGVNTNNRTVVLVNHGQDGSGTTIVATLAFNTGVNATGFTPKTITLSATAANLDIAAGDILSWQSTHGGTGIADPGGLVQVTLNRY